MTFDSIENLALLVIDAFSKGSQPRYVLGITGPPGTGKSTVSALLCHELRKSHSRRALVVPMDGFHLSNQELEDRGLRHLKGVPSTFDADGFVNLVRDIKCGAGKRVKYPTFDRENDCVVDDGGFVDQDAEIVIIEGNYLLTPAPPWHLIRNYLDQCWYVDAPRAVILPRLIRRHVEGGMSVVQAQQKVDSTDFPNAALIEEARTSADRILNFEVNVKTDMSN